MTQNKFSDIRSVLGAIRVCLSDRGIIGVMWDGDMLRVTHAIPESGKAAFVMTFDNPMEDYLADEASLIFEFMKASSAHFGPFAS